MVILGTTRPEYLMHGKYLLSPFTPHPIRVGDMLREKDYAKETQVLVRKPYEKCGKRLELLQSQIKFPSSAFPARLRTFQSQSPSLRFFPHFAHNQLGGSSSLSGSIRWQLSPFHHWERRNFIPRLPANYTHLFKPLT